MAQMDETSAGDPGVKAGMMKQWADRRHWPATLRWQMEGLHRMSAEQFEQAADSSTRLSPLRPEQWNPSCTKNDGHGCKPPS
jgi:hypothetical protein